MTAANTAFASASAGHDSTMNGPPERAMTMSEPPSYMATVASSAPHAHANAMEQGLADTTPIRHLQSEPAAAIICPHCNRRASTRVDTQSTTSTYIVGCLLCLVCIIAAILPCVFGWFDDKHHYCTECGKEVAVRHSNGEITVKKPEGVKNYGNAAAANEGNSYPMVNMGGGSNDGLGHARESSQQRQQQQQQQQREEQQRQGGQDEQISSFLSTNAPREETAAPPPVKN